MEKSFTACVVFHGRYLPLISRHDHSIFLRYIVCHKGAPVVLIPSCITDNHLIVANGDCPEQPPTLHVCNQYSSLTAASMIPTQAAPYSNQPHQQVIVITKLTLSTGATYVEDAWRVYTVYQ